MAGLLNLSLPDLKPFFALISTIFFNSERIGVQECVRNVKYTVGLIRTATFCIGIACEFANVE
jgi:hypothetical protein